MVRNDDTTSGYRVIGHAPPRPDGMPKVRGRARYVDDLDYPDLWHGAALRCPHPRARVLRIDAGAAHAADPDLVVVTAADLPGPNVVQIIRDDWPILADSEVRHAYEAVALVAAPSRARALAALDRITVEYEPLEAITDLEQALAEGAPVLHEITIEHGDLAAGFAAAAHVVEGVYETGYQEHIYIEPNGMIGCHRGAEGVDVIGSLQCPYYVHTALKRFWGLEDDEVRVRQAVTGGGFGGKEDYPNMLALHTTLLSWKAGGKPVKIVHERQEDIRASTKRHPARCRHVSALDAEGRLLAQDIEVILDGGAYTTLSPVVLSRAVIHAGGPYRCPNVRIVGKVLATNTPPNGAFRGFGAPQSQFAAERHMDRMARVLGLSPLEIRRKNAYREGDTTPTGQVLSESVSALRCLEEAAKRTDFEARWQAFEKARAKHKEAAARGEPPPAGALRGIGLSLTWHGSGFTGDGERRLAAKAGLRLAADGSVEILAASTDFGQGTSTVFAQIVAEALGIGIEGVRHVVPDTREVPDSGPTVASRTVMIVGGVLVRAAETLRERLLAALAKRRGLDPGSLTIEDGVIRTRSGEAVERFEDAARRHVAENGPCEVIEQHEPLPGHRFDERTYQGTAYPAYGWLCDVVEVELCPDTFEVNPRKMTMVCDVGRAIHPVLCKGQVEGGSLQAIAWGYMEEIKVQEGRYLNDRLQTYIIPTAADTPDMETVLIENPTSTSPTGAKGVGELPMDGGAPALVQAIENASGLWLPTIPATPERLFEAELAGQTVDAVRASAERAPRSEQGART